MTPSYTELEAARVYQRGAGLWPLGDGSGEVWQEKTDVGQQARWRAVEWNATSNESGVLEDRPTVAAVRFLGVVNGKHRCKPTTQCDMRQI